MLQMGTSTQFIIYKRSPMEILILQCKFMICHGIENSSAFCHKRVQACGKLSKRLYFRFNLSLCIVLQDAVLKHKVQYPDKCHWSRIWKRRIHAQLAFQLPSRRISYFLQYLERERLQFTRCPLWLRFYFTLQFSKHRH